MTRIGIVSSAMSLTSIGLWLALSHAQPWTPVYMPVELKPGAVRTPEFRVRMNATYQVKIVTSVRKGLSRGAIECLLGPVFRENGCTQQPVIRANWVLMGDGAVAAQGASDQFGINLESVGADGTLARAIGNLDCKRGKSYVLNVTFLEDGRALTAADPHLVVEGFGDSWEGLNLLEWVLLYLCSPSMMILGLGAFFYSSASISR